MNRSDCDIIMDLLPLYVDQVCSQDSGKLVEEHLEKCESCRSCYQEMRSDTDLVNRDACEDHAKNQLLKEINRRVTFKKVLVIAVLVILLFSMHELINRMGLNVISEDEIQISEMYQLEDGDIYLKLKSDQKGTEWFAKMFGIEKSLPDKPEWGIGLRISPFQFIKNGFHMDDEVEILVRMKDGELDVNDYGVISGGAKDILYVWGKGSRKKVLWKKGQELEHAPEEIEQEMQDWENREDIYLYNAVIGRLIN